MGKYYFHFHVFEPFQLFFCLQRVRVYFGGLFGGNQKELADTANLFFNENWRDILKEIKPSVAEAFGEVYLQFFNKIFSTKPYEEFFLP
jgi:hypothetical protein